MKRAQSLVAVLAIAALSGCMTTPLVQVYKPLDLSEKTMTVAPGSRGLVGSVKQALIADGWKVFARNAAGTIAEGTSGDRVSIRQRDEFNARYQLLATSHQFDICLVSGAPAIYFDLSVVDNKTGEEALSMSGSGCEHLVVKRFMEAARAGQ